MWLAILLLLSVSLVEHSCGFAPVIRGISRWQNAAIAPPRFRTVTAAATIDDPPPEKAAPPRERSYYQILGSSPNATRTDLKRQYVALARLTHPDALIGSGESKAAEFSEIAQAWKILSNDKERRRYDRSLQAEDFKQNVENVASAMSKSAGPRVKKVFDDFAVPFFRRTTVTTLATVSAAVERLSSQNERRGLNSLGSAFNSAVKAGVAANTVVDEMELLEKSEELEKRAKQEIEQAKLIKAELLAVVEKRLSISLATPNSGLSSFEALKLLEGLNTVDSITVMERLSMKHTIEHDIKDLEAIETEYFDSVAERTLAVEDFRYTQVALKQAARDAKQALQDEMQARKALEKAQERVSKTKQSVNHLTKAFTKIQAEERKVTNEVEAIAESMAKRQEKVRMAIRKKEVELDEQRRKEAGEPVYYVKPTPEEENPAVVEEIVQLRKEERFLTAEDSRREEKIARLLSRAAKLKARSEEGNLPPKAAQIAQPLATEQSPPPPKVEQTVQSQATEQTAEQMAQPETQSPPPMTEPLPLTQTDGVRFAKSNGNNTQGK